MAERKQQNKGAIDLQDFKGVETVKHIVHPDPYLARKKAVAAAKVGDYPKTDCPHPVSRVAQFVDDVVIEGRRTNLMECLDCHSLLFLVDPYGRAAADG